jgi:hypothetical protein
MYENSEDDTLSCYFFDIFAFSNPIYSQWNPSIFELESFLKSFFFLVFCIIICFFSLNSLVWQCNRLAAIWCFLCVFSSFNFILELLLFLESLFRILFLFSLCLLLFYLFIYLLFFSSFLSSVFFFVPNMVSKAFYVMSYIHSFS